jgi:hypothetical protein
MSVPDEATMTTTIQDANFKADANFEADDNFKANDTRLVTSGLE